MNHPIRTAPLRGEILGRRSDVRVFVARDPFRNARSEHSARAGSSIADIFIEAVGPGAPEHFVALLAGFEIQRGNWHLVRPKPGATLVFRVAPAGPLVAGIGAIFSALTSAFSAASALYAGLGAIGQAIVGTVASLAVQFALNALFPARKPQLKEPDTGTAKPSYSISGSRNQASPWDAVPTIFGIHRVTPIYGALPYTESVGEDQYLRLLFVWGYGPLYVTDIKVGETLLSSFADVQIETRAGYPDDPPATLYPRQVIEEALSVDLKQVDGWQRRTTAENVDEVSIDIVFPQGVYWVNRDDGKRYALDVLVQGRYRRVGTTEWTLFADIYQNGKTLDTIRVTRTAQVAQGQYEVEVARITQDQPTDGDASFVDNAVWTAVRGFRNSAPITFDKPLAYSVIRIRATSQLNGSLDTLNGLCASVVTSLASGGVTPNVVSRNPADHYLHLLTGAANARPVALSRIDLPALQAWNAYCYANGFTFDHIRSSKASVHETKLDICAAGRAVPVFKDGKHSVVWDEMDAPIVQMFTPSNSWGFQSEKVFPEPIHALRVRFINRDKGFVEDERIVYDDGYGPTNATLFEGQEFPGVTDPATIWKLARFHLAQRKLRPETYTLNVDWENLVCTRADRVRVAHDAALIGLQDGRVSSVDQAAQTVTLNKPIRIGSDLYRFRFRLADGSFVVRDAASPASTESSTIQLAGSGAMPEAGDLFAFGKRDIETAVFRILAVQSQPDLSATLTLVDDAPEISLADKGIIPPFQSNVSAPIDPLALAPTDLRVSERPFSTGDEVAVVLRLNWKIARQGRTTLFQVQMRNDLDGIRSWRPIGSVGATQTYIDTEPLTAGIYSFRVRSTFEDGTFSGWATAEAVSTVGLLTPPGDVLGFKISVIGDLSNLEWTPVRSVGVSFYEIRFVASGEAEDWNSATPLVANAKGTSALVPTVVGTYLIKAALASGLRSRNAALVRSNIAALAGRNVVEVLDEAPAFAGQTQGVEVSEGTLRLARRATIASWESLDTVISLNEGDGEPDSQGLEPEGFYTFANGLDLGEAFTSRLSARISAEGESMTNTLDNWQALDDVVALDGTDPDDWSVQLQYRSTMGDPAAPDSFSNWLPFVVGDVTARAFQFRLRLTGKRSESSANPYAVVTPVVRGLSVEIDMPDRMFGEKDLTVPTAGLQVQFAPAFISLKSVATADQDLATGDFKTITDKGPEGFFVQFFNADGMPVERTFDYQAAGYGSRHL